MYVHVHVHVLYGSYTVGAYESYMYCYCTCVLMY